ncbi:MAG TPA: KpsF/GutQ family sugar-phosphate isomerase [Candidatus Wallbacteria bacterium]|nr:KpsF/GutQ family sugar-phosphate isomerase [Candidatus Wallbacteria bacterium]
MEDIFIDVISEIRSILVHESAALNGLQEHIGDNYLQAVRMIHNSSGMLIVVGMGKSGLVGRKIAATLSSLGTPSAFMHASEALHGDLGMIKPNDVLLMISNSGKTRELIEIIPYAKRIGAQIIAITHNADSELARTSDVVLPLVYDSEACPFNLAPTTSTTMTLAIGDAIAIVLTKLKNFKPRDFATLHPGGSLGRRLLITVADLMHTGDQLPLASVDTPLIEALPLMSQKKLGTIIVAGGDRKLLGILTDGDLRRILCRLGADSVNARIGEVMTVNPRRISPEKLCEEAINIMESHKITTLPVVSAEGDVMGVIHLHDLLKAKIY